MAHLRTPEGNRRARRYCDRFDAHAAASEWPTWRDSQVIDSAPLCVCTIAQGASHRTCPAGTANKAVVLDG